MALIRDQFRRIPGGAGHPLPGLVDVHGVWLDARDRIDGDEELGLPET